MYNLRFEKDNGDIFYFDPEHGMLYNLDPLSELDVDISTSQGFAQIGTTVENRSVDGIERLIEGRILRYANERKHEMLNIFTPNSSGKLVFNDRYYCNCIVKTTPAIGSVMYDPGFMVRLYCEYPYWLGMEEQHVYMNTWTPCFRFPGPTSAIGTNYDAHCFGTRNTSAFVNIYNDGDIDAMFDIEFATESETYVNYGIVNIYTLEHIAVNDTLSFGETTRVYRDGAQLKVEKTLADGTVQDIFSLLDEDSDLFYLHPGDNVFRAYADDDMTPIAIISYRTTYVGVYDGM